MEFRKFKVFTENYSKIVESCTLGGAETRFWRDVPLDEDVDVIAIVDIERGRNILTDKGQLTIPVVSKRSELLIAFLKWRKGEQLTSETITEINNFLADESNL